MGAEFDELNKLTVSLVTATGNVGAKGAAVVKKSAADLQAEAQRFAPVRTGALRNSISTDMSGDGRFAEMTATVGPTVNYAPYVEFGTRRMAPSAFMGPALDRISPGFVAALEQLAGGMLDD